RTYCTRLVLRIQAMGLRCRRRNHGTAGKSLRAWWQPVLKMSLDDPEQEPPFWVATNNVVLNTPFPGIQIKALAIVKSFGIRLVIASGSGRVFMRSDGTLVPTETEKSTLFARGASGLEM